MIGSSFPINRVTKASPSDPERDPGSAVAIAAFTLVVPGFFAYHVLAGFGLIPLVLRGYSTAIATLVLLPMLFVYVRHALRWGRYTPPVDALFLGFVAYLVLVVAIQTLRGAPTAITSSHLAIAVQFLALFAIFSLVDINDRRFRALYQLSFVAMTTIIFANVSEGSFVVAAIDLGPAEEGQADYQGYAFVYLVTTLFCAVSLRRVVLRVLVYLLATPALFLNGARSEFLGFLVAILLIELCITRRRLLVVAIIAALCVAGAIAVLAFVDMLSNNRVLDLIEYTASDSVSERREAMVLAWRTVSESPLLGDYGSYRVEIGRAHV